MLILYGDAAYYISIQQHSETELLAGPESLTHALQHGVLMNMAAWTSCCCRSDDFSIPGHVSHARQALCSCPCLSLLACGSQHLATAMQHYHLVPQLHPSCMLRVHARGHADQYESCCADVLLRSPMQKQTRSSKVITHC